MQKNIMRVLVRQSVMIFAKAFPRFRVIITCSVKFRVITQPYAYQRMIDMPMAVMRGARRGLLRSGR